MAGQGLVATAGAKIRLPSFPCLGSSSAFSQRKPPSRSGAVIVGPYRYTLWRTIGTRSPFLPILFLMLNPSTADALTDDPTIRRCLAFAGAWGYQSLEVCNLFAFRATNPGLLLRAKDPVGPDNDSYIRAAVARAATVVVAWGAQPSCIGRAAAVLPLVDGARNVFCLGVTKSGFPRHPLYVPRTAVPITYDSSPSLSAQAPALPCRSLF